MLTNIFSSLIFPALFAYSLNTNPKVPGISLYVSAGCALLAAYYLKVYLDSETHTLRSSVLDESTSDELGAYSPLDVIDALDSNNTLLGTYGDHHVLYLYLPTHAYSYFNYLHSYLPNSI